MRSIKGKVPKNTIQIAVLCGGPSPERGISLNSARSLADHLTAGGFNVHPFYFDYKKQPYRIERSHLYSNTPSDFDFKLKKIAQPLSMKQLVKALRELSFVFPAIHGKFGEDGELQDFLEKNRIPFIGSSANACRQAFDKYTSSVILAEHHYRSVPTLLIEKKSKNTLAIRHFFNAIKNKKAILKPARSGSSIGVTPVSSLAEIYQACEQLWNAHIDDRLVLQPFLEGIEFTVIVIENRFGLPVALFPTEIEVDYAVNGIFDYRKKYLPTRDRHYFCPPRFDDEHIDSIRVQAGQLFKLFGMRDYARFDGWILHDGSIVFTDFNPVSGMEQNSFLFQQAAQLGMSHRDVVSYLAHKAIERTTTLSHDKKIISNGSLKKHKKMAVLFGGSTAERQVSVMSGTNAWLKLKDTMDYAIEPYLLEPDNATVWHVPYYACLNHTVEEMLESCHRAVAHRDHMHHLRKKVSGELALLPHQASETAFDPHTHSLSTLINAVDYVFIALHGGIGEDGTLQGMLEKKHQLFNGPGSAVSKICMDKFETGKRLSGLEKEGIFSAPKKLISVKELKKIIHGYEGEAWWNKLLLGFNAKTIIAKPHADGCSAGCVQLESYADLVAYINIINKGIEVIPSGTFSNQHAVIEMPRDPMTHVLFEKWIETDVIIAKNNKLFWEKTSGWIEVTVGVIGEKASMHVLSPSLTVARSGVLSLEEKFQGGTGINITPPPESYVKKNVLEKVKIRIKKVCDVLAIEGYSRIDAFIHTQTGEIIIIEVNTLPALTPSTVLYHQGLAEKPPLFPQELLAKFVTLGEKRYS